MKKFYISAFLFFAGLALNAQIINIPDPALKAKLTGILCASHSSSMEVFNYYVDSNGDGQIQQSEADAVYGLSISTSTGNTVGDITSLEGLQYFPNLKVLFCGGNNLSSLDLTAFPNLIKAELTHDNIANLTVSGMANLQSLNIGANQLTALNLSNLPALSLLAVFNNQLTSVDLTGTPNLVQFECNNNQLSSFTSPALPFLTTLNLPNNHLTGIDLTLFPSLHMLDVSQNPITAVNLSGTPIMWANVSMTLVTQIDCSGSQVDHLFCDGCMNLTQVNVQNSVISWGDADMLDFPFRFYSCPGLVSVCTDPGEVLWIGSSGVDINQTAVYTGPNCSGEPWTGPNQVIVSYTYDDDGNGCDAGDMHPQNMQTQFNGFSGSSYMIMNGLSGYYFPAGQVTVTPTPQPNVASYFTISPPNYNFNFNGSGSVEHADFCITANGVHPDMDVSASAMGGAVPGFDSNYRITYRNKGNQIQSGTISFTFDDSILDFVSSNNAATVSGNVVSWSFSNLNPFTQGEITVRLHLNSPLDTPPVNSGDQLAFTTSADGLPNDETPQNNTHTMSQTVVNSFDPNDKSVAEGDEIGLTQVGNYLHYQVRFQNTGTAPAQNVSITDILSDNLDASTIEVISASHQYIATLTDGNKLTFRFNGINLPAESTDEPGSHGYISFMVKSKPDLVIDDVVENTASIYFDFNLPIVTNTVATTVVALSTDEFADTELALYPNPAGQYFTLAAKEILKKIEILNMIGQTVKTIPASADTELINVADLSSGTYFVRATTDGGTIVKKLIKL